MEHLSGAVELTFDQLDLVMVGAVLSVLNTNKEIFDKNHKSKDSNKCILSICLVASMSAIALFLVWVKIIYKPLRQTTRKMV